MRVTKITFTTCLFFLFALVATAQKSTIRGTVFDGKTGEYLPGVTIYIEGTTTGTITDLDGNFNLPIEPGTYNVRISFISYQTVNLTGVQVKPGEPTLLGDIQLKEATIELGEATVVASQIRNTESALLTLKKNSANVVDGISAAQLKRTGDSDAASSMKRVTGVSVEGGKYVYVRGLGDRYTKTVLNGLDIPGLDPDRNSLQMDIFPTGVVDNLVVNKSFSAELPADFTGGIVNIELKDFPEERVTDLSASLEYNPNVHLRKDFVSYDGGKTDWLGFDDGTRDIPATGNIPLFSEVVGNPSGIQGQRYREILRGFNPTMSARRMNSAVDFSVGFSMGNQFSVGKYKLGYIFSASYKSNSEFYKNAEYGRYGMSSEAGVYELETREIQSGDFGKQSVLLSGLAGVALKSQYAKYRMNVLHLQNGESTAGIFDYHKSDLGTSFAGFQHNLEYNQRRLTSILLDGKYLYPDRKWEVEWKITPTFSSNYDPDIRFTRYEQRDGYLSIGTEVGFPERIWRDLKELNLAGVLHISKKFSIRKEEARLRFGGAYTWKDREFVIRNYAINVRNISLTGNPDELFNEENLWPYQGNIGKGTTYEAPFSPVNPNQYDATVRNIAGYASLEFSPVHNLKTIVGLRAESYTQRYTGQDQLGINVLDNEKVLDKPGFFPALNLIYNLNEKQNLRFSYAQTIARPSFKELSYAEIFDPITGRTFIGGLFRDADDIAGIEYWDGNLTSTSIQNFDLRWEMYPGYGQTVAASLFYKQFNQPIEMVEYATQTGSYQPRNVGNGRLLGAEFEYRKNLKAISQSLEPFVLNLNFTYTHSEIKMSETERQSRQDNARTGQTIGTTRQMAGQAPFIVNAGLLFNGAQNGFGKGLTAGLFYNVQGATLQYVGMVDRPDVYTLPFHSLNFNATKVFGSRERFSAGLKIDNLLNSKKEAVYRSYKAADRYFYRLSPGIAFQLKLAYSF